MCNGKMYVIQYKQLLSYTISPPVHMRECMHVRRTVTHMQHHHSLSCRRARLQHIHSCCFRRSLCVAIRPLPLPLSVHHVFSLSILSLLSLSLSISLSFPHFPLCPARPLSTPFCLLSPSPSCWTCETPATDPYTNHIQHNTSEKTVCETIGTRSPPRKKFRLQT